MQNKGVMLTNLRKIVVRMQAIKRTVADPKNTVSSNQRVLFPGHSLHNTISGQSLRADKGKFTIIEAIFTHNTSAQNDLHW